MHNFLWHPANLWNLIESSEPVDVSRALNFEICLKLIKVKNDAINLTLLIHRALIVHFFMRFLQANLPRMPMNEV